MEETGKGRLRMIHETQTIRSIHYLGSKLRMLDAIKAAIDKVATKDGAVLLTNTISSPPVTQQIISKIKAAGIYAVSIDYDIPEFFHIGIDNRTAMMEMTRHFINHHGFRKIKYISGPDDNPESIDRLDGFKKVMQENNILVNENDIFYGDFRFPSGREAVETFLKQSDELPEVIICANDAMAISAISALNDEIGRASCRERV
mgnify:CR=1 FL=1